MAQSGTARSGIGRLAPHRISRWHQCIVLGSYPRQWSCRTGEFPQLIANVSACAAFSWLMLETATRRIWNRRPMLRGQWPRIRRPTPQRPSDGTLATRHQESARQAGDSLVTCGIARVMPIAFATVTIHGKRTESHSPVPWQFASQWHPKRANPLWDRRLVGIATAARPATATCILESRRTALRLAAPRRRLLVVPARKDQCGHVVGGERMQLCQSTLQYRQRTLLRQSRLRRHGRRQFHRRSSRRR